MGRRLEGAMGRSWKVRWGGAGRCDGEELEGGCGLGQVDELSRYCQATLPMTTRLTTE